MPDKVINKTYSRGKAVEFTFNGGNTTKVASVVASQTYTYLNGNFATRVSIERLFFGSETYTATTNSYGEITLSGALNSGEKVDFSQYWTSSTLITFNGSVKATFTTQSYNGGTITLDNEKTSSIGINGYTYYSFTPSISGNYIFTFSNNSNLKGWISTSNSYSGGGATSPVSSNLNSGTRYYLCVKNTGNDYLSPISCTVKISYVPPETQITYISGTSSIKKTYNSNSFNLDSISSLGFTKSGWSFKGWATSTETSNVTYSNGGSYTGTIGQAATLYAVWEKIIIATLYSGLNNAAISSVQGRLSSYNTSNSNTYEDTIAYINLPNNSLNFSYDNRQFTPNDWGLLSDNNYTFYPQNSSVSISGGENFYLRYVNNALTLSYDKNSEEAIGQIESQVSLQTYINNNFSEVNFTIAENTFENKKQSFNGFSTAADGADEIYQPNGIITISKNTMLYAIWGAMASTSSPFYYNGKSCLLFLRKNNKYYPIILGVSSNGE